MPAPKGNQFWKARTKHGRDKLFTTPEILLEACLEYFEWVDRNPLYEYQLKTTKGRVHKIPVPKMRAMTIGGLCIFLNINQSTWFDYAKQKGQEGEDKEITKDFSNICTRVMEIIRNQKFAGAAADLLNANIIARDLGLKDKSEIDHSGYIETAERPKISRDDWLRLHGLDPDKAKEG